MRPASRRFVWLGAGVCLAAAGYSLGQDKPRGEMMLTCRHEGADGGESGPIDLDKVRREYARAQELLERRIDRTVVEARALVDQPLNVGLPSCRYPERRRSQLRSLLPPQLRGTTFVLVSAVDGDCAIGFARRYPGAHVLITNSKSLNQIGDLSKRLEKAVGIATRELAASLGITCVPAAVTVNEKGDAVELSQGD